MGTPREVYHRTVFAWAATVGAAIEHRTIVHAYCGRCSFWKVADLRAIAKAKGPDWSLYDRRLKCPTADCKGPVLFRASPARGTPLRPLRTRLYGLDPEP
jgi:hypothetical protein